MVRSFWQKAAAVEEDEDQAGCKGGMESVPVLVAGSGWGEQPEVCTGVKVSIVQQRQAQTSQWGKRIGEGWAAAAEVMLSAIEFNSDSNSRCATPHHFIPNEFMEQIP